MVFKLINIEQKRDYSNDDDPYLFATGAEANVASKNLEIIFGIKYGVRPYTPPSDDWKDREQGRFDDGTYTKVLPSLQKHCLPDHYVHVAKEKPDMLSYTQNAFKGSNDIQSRISVTGYLEKFGKISKEDAENYQDDHEMAFAAMELQWAKTPEEIEHVYTNYALDIAGVNDSCMRYTGCKITNSNIGIWYSQIHPIRVYGNSDLQLAYITDSDGKTIARALTYEKNMVYSRCYGSGDSTNKLHRLLKKKGYRKSQTYYGIERGEKEDKTRTLHGARIPAIRWRGTQMYDEGGYETRPETWFVMPYIDEAEHLTLREDENGKEYFLFGKHTVGLGELSPKPTCGVLSMIINRYRNPRTSPSMTAPTGTPMTYDGYYSSNHTITIAV